MTVARDDALHTGQRELLAVNDASVLDATGYVVARRHATVSAKVTGKVAELLLEEACAWTPDNCASRASRRTT